MFYQNLFYSIILFNFIIFVQNRINNNIDPKKSKIWGPGIYPDKIVMPARYFFVQLLDSKGALINQTGQNPIIRINGLEQTQKYPCRIWKQIFPIENSTFIIRYKLFQNCLKFQIEVKYITNLDNNENHLSASPFKFAKMIKMDECYCPESNLTKWFEDYQCPESYKQIDNDLELFKPMNFKNIKKQILIKFKDPRQTSLCNYAVKENKVYRKCYGDHVGFNIFMDGILLSLTRKIKLPNFEFFANLGDWPLELHKYYKIRPKENILPIFSWCGSDNSYDIVMPTYDITESTLENMGRVSLDMVSSQSESYKRFKWPAKIPKLFWRGRDSCSERLKLVEISRDHPELFNVSLTNFFFFRDKEKSHGPKTAHVSFFEFFNYKYQLNIDGTVASYRFPYLLAGNSVVLKQDSFYYEHFYRDLQPWVHYIPVKRDLNDLVDKIKWAQQNDEKARTISENGRIYARKNLFAKDIFCYHAKLFSKWSQLLTNEIILDDGMELIKQMDQKDCSKCVNSQLKDEL